MKTLTPELEKSLRGVADSIREQCDDYLKTPHKDPSVSTVFDTIKTVSKLLDQGFDALAKSNESDLINSLGEKAFGRNAKMGMYDVRDPGKRDPMISTMMAGMSNHINLTIQLLTNINSMLISEARGFQLTEQDRQIMKEKLVKSIMLLCDLHYTFKL